MTYSRHSSEPAAAPRSLSPSELDQVSGGFLMLIFPIITGIGLGIGYCIMDGTLDPKPPRGSPPGDYPTVPKNAA